PPFLSTANRLKSSDDGQDTTSNRMELTAALKGIGQVRPGANLTMVGNSQYVVRGMSEWVAGWQANGWRTNGGKRVENADLWGALVAAVRRHGRVTWRTA
ncbi:RNase H family protein, partial [Methylorubrum thiocyanatum]|uniref:RNase H family protein n=1 Tax=Methylorubrum thiocyanatum TaxID=47958 RepID=UPI0035C82501